MVRSEEKLFRLCSRAGGRVWDAGRKLPHTRSSYHLNFQTASAPFAPPVLAVTVRWGQRSRFTTQCVRKFAAADGEFFSQITLRSDDALYRLIERFVCRMRCSRLPPQWRNVSHFTCQNGDFSNTLRHFVNATQSIIWTGANFNKKFGMNIQKFCSTLYLQIFAILDRIVCLKQ